MTAPANASIGVAATPLPHRQLRNLAAVLRYAGEHIEDARNIAAGDGERIAMADMVRSLSEIAARIRDERERLRSLMEPAR